MEGLVKPYIVPNCSCEGLCVHLHAIFDAMVREHTGGRAWISGIEIEEDSKELGHLPALAGMALS